MFQGHSFISTSYLRGQTQRLFPEMITESHGVLSKMSWGFFLDNEEAAADPCSTWKLDQDPKVTVEKDPWLPETLWPLGPLCSYDFGSAYRASLLQPNSAGSVDMAGGGTLAQLPGPTRVEVRVK